MINFFRKIRKKMTDDNKPMKYLRYAIGEIVLVVVGILIALQVNNWNEERKIKSIEKTILIDLKAEIISNIAALEETIEEHEKSFNASRELARLINSPSERESLADKTINKLFITARHNWTYNQNKGILNSIISSGQINYIRNNNLKYLLTSLSDMTEDAMESTSAIQVDRNPLINVVLVKSIELNEERVLKLNPKKIFEIPEFIIANKRLFSGVRSQGLKEERELLNTMKKMEELINIEID